VESVASVAHEGRFKLEDIIALFDGVFERTYKTRLIRGDDEPLYRPASDDTPYHQVIFAHGFYASALHEISHWCIAGEARRRCEDYGYWYLPDGRNAEQQRAFEQAEIAPQALESLFAAACEREFRVSVDNLGGDADVDRHAFAETVRTRAECYVKDGMPLRAGAFREALYHYYQTPATLEQACIAGRQMLSDA